MQKRNIPHNNLKVNPKDFKPYLDLPDRALFPLFRWDAVDQETGKKLGKVPKVKWSKYVLTENKFENAIRTNHNIGFRIPEDILIIDYDPRNDENKNALDNLLVDFKISVTDNPVVNTGGGGLHIYLKKPEGASIKKNLRSYQGIDFLSKGCFVVCAGSVHPNGKRYEWDKFSDNDLSQASLKATPKKLLKELDRGAYQNDLGGGKEWGEFSVEQLEKCLSVLPAEDFRGHGDWLKIMMSAHYMTGGEGFDAFQAWCETDETFIGTENMHRIRWYSMSDKGRGNNIGSGSMFKEISQRGSNWMECVAVSAEKDFAELDAELEDILLNNDDPHSVAAGKLYKVALNIDIDKVNAIDVGRIYNKLDEIPILVRTKIMDHFVNKLKIQKSDLSKYSRAAKNSDKDIRDKSDVAEDTARRLARAVLKHEFSGNRLLYIDDVWWRYIGTHWEQVNSDSVIGRTVKDVLDRFRGKHEDVTFGSETMLISNTIKMLGYEVATTVGETNMYGQPQTVINCKNGELWLLPDGTVDLREHKPSSLLTTKPTITYNKKAKSKLFKKAMSDTFANFKDKKDMVRHIEEVIGYMIQPTKDIEAFWLFKGPGGDGKTTLTEVIMGLAGTEAAAPVNVEALSKDNTHALHAIVGKLVLVDDDLASSTKLDDSVMKKLSSNKMLSANPKFKREFNFVNTAQLIMCSNSYPRYGDLSRGLRRRMQIIPFNRQFDIDGGEVKSFSKVLLCSTEASGVLNIVLAGLKRLRKRGKFKKPESCILEENIWHTEASPMQEFISTCTVETRLKKESGKDIYNSYCLWYSNMYGGQETYRVGLRKFYQELNQMGFIRARMHGNVVAFWGLNIKKEHRNEFEEQE